MQPHELFDRHQHWVPITVRERFPYPPDGMTREDLCQEGYIGLWQASLAWTGGYNNRFQPYAITKIVRTIGEAIRTKRRVRRSVHDLIRKTVETRDQLTSQLRRTPTLEEMAREWRTDLGSMQSVLRLVNSTVLCDIDEIQHLGDRADYNAQMATDNDIQIVHRLLEHLEPTERVVLTLVFFEEYTYRKAATLLRITERECRAIGEAAISKVRKLGRSLWNNEEQSFELSR